MFLWARQRAGLETGDLVGKFPKYREWESGKHRPTMLEAADFAKAVHVPITYLYLPEPPDNELGIPDNRTEDCGYRGQNMPSPDLVDTVHSCEWRQEWYRIKCTEKEGFRPLDFVGSATLGDTADDVAEAIRKWLRLDPIGFRQLRSVESAFSALLSKADAAGILVMVDGRVENYSRRMLDPQEFRGFALSDSLAPLIFINGRDAKTAQVFTLAHELAYIWLGESALSDVFPLKGKPNEAERWCYDVASELLVPREDLRSEFRKGNDLQAEISRLVRKYKVISLVIVRRLQKTRLIGRPQFDKALPLEQSKFVDYYKTKPRGMGEGRFRTQLRRVGRRFAKAVVRREATTKMPFREALQLLSLRNEEAFDSFAEELANSD